MLDPTSDVDLYCLHYVYVSRINAALNMFMDGWNSHAVTTEHSMTPTHLFTAGTLISGRGLVLPSNLHVSNGDGMCLNHETVTVPLTNCPLTDQQRRRLDTVVEASSVDDDDYGVQLYNNKICGNKIQMHMIS